MPLPEEPENELYLRSQKTDPANNKDGVFESWWNRNHATKGGSTRDPLWWSMDFDKTPETNLFLASHSESRGRDPI